MIRFSIVTPSFNQGRFIERTIESVVSQSSPAFSMDYLVMDGGSHDQTLEILRRYEGRLRWTSTPDAGQADAVNRGILSTSGDVIGWINSDDLYRPGALLTVSAYFGRHPEIDIVYGDAYLIDVDDRIIGRYYTEPWNPNRLPRRPFLCQPAVFFRRRVVERFGLLDARLQYSMDYEYWLRAAKGRATFAYLPLKLACSRIHPETKTLLGGVGIHDELNVMLKRYVKTIPDAWILTHTHAILRQQRRETFNNPLGFAVAVALVSVRLSIELNRSISPGMVLSTARTLSAGAVKTLLGKPVVLPTE